MRVPNMYDSQMAELICPFACHPAGSTQPDLQMRFVPAAAIDPDGVGSYALFPKLVEQNQRCAAGSPSKCTAHPAQRALVQAVNSSTAKNPLHMVK